MDPTTQLLARTFAVTAGALFSWSMIDLVVRDRLKWYLADQKFEILVVIGGVLLGAVVLLKIRALMIPGTGHSHDHDHDHEHGHDHGHEHEGHQHGSVSLWRYIVLAFPLMIIVMGLSPDGISAGNLENRMTRSQREAIAAVTNVTLPPGRSPEGKIVSVDAPELQQAASQPDRRAFWESTTHPVRAKIAGELVPDSRYTDRYRLMRIKLTCCVADASPVGVTVLGEVDPKWNAKGQWLEVVGPVSFFEVANPKTGVPEFYPLIHQQQAKPTTPRVYLQ